MVAPVRERGLKSCGQCLGCRLDSRSREGAWIEIAAGNSAKAANRRRSREGAWIEMPKNAIYIILSLVAPVRERGLKLQMPIEKYLQAVSLP